MTEHHLVDQTTALGAISSLSLNTSRQGEVLQKRSESSTSGMIRRSPRRGRHRDGWSSTRAASAASSAAVTRPAPLREGGEPDRRPRGGTLTHLSAERAPPARICHRPRRCRGLQAGLRGGSARGSDAAPRRSEALPGAADPGRLRHRSPLRSSPRRSPGAPGRAPPDPARGPTGIHPRTPNPTHRPPHRPHLAGQGGAGPRARAPRAAPPRATAPPRAGGARPHSPSLGTAGQAPPPTGHVTARTPLAPPLLEPHPREPRLWPRPLRDFPLCDVTSERHVWAVAWVT
ncbi:translation initiation factor IF-2-like [Chiroxiphia lanceolata]|uniref:translation initiation factor IF-2-like n=1 Tax=Chiroxiphia lanceolata TaxID=296741 RepID=UPI0013CE45C9|nr:translation initiation factor IF-2-like [Chiroxiphia lanceolata]